MRCLALSALAFLLLGCDESAPTAANDERPQLAQGGNQDKTIVLRIIGTGQQYAGTVPDLDGDGVDDPALCVDVPVLDLPSGYRGSASECYSDWVGTVDDRLTAVATTFFRFGNGFKDSFAIRMPVTLHADDSARIGTLTHLSGGISPGEDVVLSSTGRFKNLAATVRFTGAVGIPQVGETWSFDHLYVVEQF